MRAGSIIVCVSLVLMNFQFPIDAFSNTDGPTFPLDATTEKYYYVIGEEINITITNIGDGPIDFLNPPNFQVLIDPFEWVRNPCPSMGQVVTHLNPGEKRVFRWDQKYFHCYHPGDPTPPNGEQVPPGEYRLIAGSGNARYAGEKRPMADTVWIEIGPAGGSPVADAGPNQTVNVGDIVQFDGSGSFHPDGDYVFGESIRVNDDNTLRGQFWPTIHVDRNGTVHVVWSDGRDYDLYYVDVYYAKSIDGGQSFQNNLRVNDDATWEYQGQPYVTTNDDLEVLVAFRDERNSKPPEFINQVYFAKSIDQGQSFEPNVRVIDDAGVLTSIVYSISIGSFGSDEVFVAWHDYRDWANTGSDIYFSGSSDGGLTFGPDVRVTDDTNRTDQSVVSMDVDGEGNIYLVWVDSRNLLQSDYDIYLSKSTDRGKTFSPNVKAIEDVGRVPQSYPSIAVDNEGDMNLVWMGVGDPSKLAEIFFARSTDGGNSFGPNVRVNDDLTNVSQLFPKTATNTFGDIYVVWEDLGRGNQSDIYLSISTDGGESFRKDMRVNDIEEYGQVSPWVAVDNEGNPHVVWRDYRNDFGDIYYAKGTPTLDYDWDFDDGSPHGSGMRPVHIYNTPGVHSVTLTVTDAQGASDSDNCIITVLSGDQPPVADAGPDQTVNEGDIVQFDGSGSYDPGANWVNMTVDSADDVGKHVSIAIDSNDNPHIAYKDDTNDYVKYARYSGGAWNFEMVDAIGKGEGAISLALDSNDMPHISYYDSNDDILKYAVWNGLAWETEVVDSTSGSGFWNSMALDSNDWAHISYYYGYPGYALKYAKWNGSDWEIETVDSNEDVVGWYNSIAVDSNDWPHISYRDETNEDLKYARWTGNSWSVEAVDTTGRQGLHTSIAMDSYDNPHISYSDSTDWTLKYASWTGSMWNIEVADSVDHVGFQTSIAMDSYDNPHISYNDMTNWHLKYALRSGGLWNVEIVDIDHNQIWETSIALDSMDDPHITYTNWGIISYDLKYANKRGGIVSYDWDFDASVDLDGDGNHTNDVEATGPTPTHVYGDDGVYTVTLKVTDKSGLWDTDTTIVTVLNVPPIADAGGPYIGFEGTPLLLLGSHTDPGFLDTHVYEWDLYYDGTAFTPDMTGEFVQKTWYDDYSGIIALRVTDDDGGWDLDVTTVTIENVPPIANAGDDKEGFEVSTFTFNGGFYDPGSNDTHTFEWDFDYDGINFNVEETGQSTSHTFIDDFDGEVAVRVTDDDGGADIDTAHVLVKNVPPTVTLEVLPIEVDAFLRIAGEKWHDVTIELYEDGVLMANGTLVRYPGSPNDQMLNLSSLQFDYSKKYSATIRYTPDDDPINGQPNGANPCWIILRFSDGQELWIQHTFNVQHPDTYVWEVDLTAAILSHGMTFKATASDPGADELTFHWDFGDGTNVTTFYPNVNETYPVEIMETINHAFPGSGTYTVTVTVEDDDGGIGVAMITVTIP